MTWKWLKLELKVPFLIAFFPTNLKDIDNHLGLNYGKLRSWSIEVESDSKYGFSILDVISWNFCRKVERERGRIVRIFFLVLFFSLLKASLHIFVDYQVWESIIHLGKLNVWPMYIIQNFSGIQYILHYHLWNCFQDLLASVDVIII